MSLPVRRTLSVLLGLGLVLAQRQAAGAGTTAWVSLRWSPVAGASAYEVQLGTRPNFDEPLLQRRSSQASLRWAGLPDRALYWRVRSIDARGEPGKWSATAAVPRRLPAPGLKRPPEAAVLLRSSDKRALPIAARSVSGAAAYRLEMKRPGGEWSEAYRLRSPEPRFEARPPGLGEWRWRVVALDPRGLPSAPSEVRSLSLRPGPPAPSAPSPGQELRAEEGQARADLRWEALQGVSAWRVTVEQPGEPRTLWRRRTKRPRVRFETGFPGVYRWWVQAEAGAHRSPPSEPRRFLVQPHGSQLLSPPDGACLVRLEGQSPSAELAWAGAPGLGYVVEVAANPEFEGELFRTELSEPHLNLPNLDRLTSTLVKGGGPSASAQEGDDVQTLWWRVWAGLKGGARTRSPHARIVLRRLAGAPPELLDPPDGAMRPGKSALELRWRPVPGAERYELGWGGAGEPQGRLEVEETSLTLEELPQDPLVWRVRAWTCERPGPWSPARVLLRRVPRPAEVRISAQPGALPADGRSSARLVATVLDSSGRRLPTEALRMKWSSEFGSVAPLPGGLGASASLRAPARLPASGRTTVTLNAHGLEGQTAVDLLEPAPPAAQLGLHLGWRASGGALSSPYLASDLLLGARVWGLPLFAALELGLSHVEQELSSGALQVRGSALLLPLSLWVGAGWRSGAWRLRAGLGGSLELARFEQEGARRLSLGSAAVARAELARAQGPGEWVAALGARSGELSSDIGRLRTSGLALGAGYRVELP